VRLTVRVGLLLWQHNDVLALDKKDPDVREHSLTRRHQRLIGLRIHTVCCWFRNHRVANESAIVASANIQVGIMSSRFARRAARAAKTARAPSARRSAPLPL
jgi:hypothetical protein